MNENTFQSPVSEPIKQKVNWHKISKICLAISKLGVLFFVFLIGSNIILDIIRRPYSYFFIGIGFCLFAFVFFNMIRANTFKPNFNKYDFTALRTTDGLFFKLMTDLDFEINKFEGNAMYYFGSVKSYKYYTVALSGLSTVVLGLDLTGIRLPLPVNYTLLSKNIALVIGAIITIISTMAIYWNVEKYWLQNKIILQRFRQLREEIEFADKKNTLSADEINSFCDRFKEIKHDFYKYWEGVQAERNNK